MEVANVEIIRSRLTNAANVCATSLYELRMARQREARARAAFEKALAEYRESVGVRAVRAPREAHVPTFGATR